MYPGLGLLVTRCWISCLLTNGAMVGLLHQRIQQRFQILLGCLPGRKLRAAENRLLVVS